MKSALIKAIENTEIKYKIKPGYSWRVSHFVFKTVCFDFLNEKQ